MDIGSAVGRKQGLVEQQILEINQYETSDAFSPLEKLVLRYATLMAQARVDVPEELIIELRTQLSDPQVIELTSTIAWENYRSRFNRALGVEAVGYSEGAVCAIPHRQPLNLASAA